MNSKCVFLGTKEKIEEVYGEKLLAEMQDKIGADKSAVSRKGDKDLEGYR